MCQALDEPVHGCKVLMLCMFAIITCHIRTIHWQIHTIGRCYKKNTVTVINTGVYHVAHNVSESVYFQIDETRSNFEGSGDILRHER